MSQSALTRGGLGVRTIQPAYRQVAEQLRTLILNGELAIGEGLPSETELSSMFGVSRSTVREALRVLSSQSLIRTSRGVGGGSFVSQPQPAEISAYLETSIGLLSTTDAVTVAQLLEARQLFEPPGAGLAAQRRTEDQLAQLRESLAIERAAVERDQFEEHRRFHRILLDASGNALLMIMTQPVYQVLRTRFAREAAPRSFWHQVVDEHVRILDRVEAGDAEGAELEMRHHLERLADTYRDIDRLPLETE